MDKLIITVTTDSSMSYPRNPHNIECTNAEAIAEEYIRAINAGAAIVHTHGSYDHDPVIQPDGRKLAIPILEGWGVIVNRVREVGNPIIQFGLASMRKEQKLELWEKFKPDMSSICFNSHDEYFQPYPDYPAFSVYSVHPIDELREYSRLAKQYGVKLEIECFHTGAFWAIGKIREGIFWSEEGEREVEEGLLPDPLWLTLFFGWDGQSWTPPTVRAMQYMIDNLPPRANWSTSCMEPQVYWSVITQAILMGGHVRVGWEDCPYLEDGGYAETNAQLVEKAVNIAKGIGREIASPDEARQITGLNPTTS